MQKNYEKEKIDNVERKERSVCMHVRERRGKRESLSFFPPFFSLNLSFTFVHEGI